MHSQSSDLDKTRLLYDCEQLTACLVVKTEEDLQVPLVCCAPQVSFIAAANDRLRT